MNAFLGLLFACVWWILLVSVAVSVSVLVITLVADWLVEHDRRRDALEALWDAPAREPVQR